MRRRLVRMGGLEELIGLIRLIRASDATDGRDKMEVVGRATWANKFTEDPEPSDKSRKNIFTPNVRAIGEEKFW